jgi:hypothetical protein
MDMFSKEEKMLLMGSSKYRNKILPLEIRDFVDKAIEHGMTFIVAEAHGSCRLFQDYLAEKKYERVIVGHAKSIRYNAGNWPDVKYGDNLKEREYNMIKDCYSAIVIWQDNSGVIAQNLENLKKLRKPTFLYEYNSTRDSIQIGPLDPDSTYITYFPYRK